MVHEIEESLIVIDMLRMLTSVSSLQIPGAAEAVRTDLTCVEARPHVVLLVELEKTSDLFKLSHSLVDLFSEWCVAWYAVGRCSTKHLIVI